MHTLLPSPSGIVHKQAELPFTGRRKKITARGIPMVYGMSFAPENRCCRGYCRVKSAIPGRLDQTDELPNQDVVMSKDTFDPEAFLDAAAAAMDLTIDPVWRPAVLDNLQRSRQIAQAVLNFPLPDDVEAASIFRP